MSRSAILSVHAVRALFYASFFATLLLFTVRLFAEESKPEAEKSSPNQSQPDTQEGLILKKPEEIEAARPSDFWIGAQVAPVPASLLGQFGVDEEKGGLIVIEQVMPQSPAEAAGLKRGDILLTYGGRELCTFRDLVKQVGEGRGTPQKVEILRGHQKQELEITAAERPAMLRAQGGLPGGFGAFAGPQELRFKLDGGDPEEMMRQMQEMMRQMQAQGGAGVMLPGGAAGMAAKMQANGNSIDRLEVATLTGPDGKTTIRVKRVVGKGNSQEEKSWEVEKVDDLPEDIRADVRAMLKQDNAP